MESDRQKRITELMGNSNAYLEQQRYDEARQVLESLTQETAGKVPLHIRLTALKFLGVIDFKNEDWQSCWDCQSFLMA